MCFGSLPSPLGRAQTQVVIDDLHQTVGRVNCQLDVLPSPLSDKAKEEESFLAHAPEEILYLLGLVANDQERLVVLEAGDLSQPLLPDLDVLCVPDRSSPFDAFLNRQGLIMDDLDPGSRIGVMSLRSRIQMQALWPDLSFQILRGGVDRAMEIHLRKSEIDGLVLPAAVTEHLGIQGIVAEVFSPDFLLPGPCQGLLVVIGRKDDQEARSLLSELHSEASSQELGAEKAFQKRMVTDQDLPVGALARVKGQGVTILGCTGAGGQLLSASGSCQESEQIGTLLADQLLLNPDTFLDLLEADFPDGLPPDEDEPFDDEDY